MMEGSFVYSATENSTAFLSPTFLQPLPPSGRFATATVASMDKRSGESPMDFEWQTRAPGDVTSPFYQLSMQHENQKKRMPPPPVQYCHYQSGEAKANGR